MHIWRKICRFNRSQDSDSEKKIFFFKPKGSNKGPERKDTEKEKLKPGRNLQ